MHVDCTLLPLQIAAREQLHWRRFEERWRGEGLGTQLLSAWQDTKFSIPACMSSGLFVTL